MNALPALLCLSMIPCLWRDLPLSARAAWQLKWFSMGVVALLLTSIVLSVSPGALPQTLAEVGLRVWYATLSVVLGALTFICAPGLSKRPLVVAVPVAVSVVLLLCSDLFVAGVTYLPTAYGFSDMMVTRERGSHYVIWAWLLRAVVIVQLVYLVVRIKNAADGRDRNSAMVLLCSLIAGHALAGVMSIEMQRPQPAVNALPFIGVVLIPIIAGVFYTQRRFKMAVFNTRAMRHDQCRLQTIYAAFDSASANCELGASLLCTLEDGPQTFLLRHGQAVPVGDIGKLAWCDTLEAELGHITDRWPIVTPQKLS